MSQANLPNGFEPRECPDLVRLGRDNDGGYLASLNDVKASDFLLSMGVNHDWSFEVDFARHTDCNIHAYDASVGFRTLFTSAVKAIVTFRLCAAYQRLRNLVHYLIFFQGQRTHIRKFIGFDVKDYSLSLAEAIARAGSDKIFVKMDIEGWEYRTLDDLVDCVDFLKGAIIEFHDVDLHLDKIIEFIEKFDIELAHVHANNFATVSPEGIPLVLELTFSRHVSANRTSSSFPHSLDMPNCISLHEIEIGFERSLP